MTSNDAPPGAAIPYTLTEMAARTNISVDEFERAIAARELGYITIGGGQKRLHRRLTDELVAAWFASRTVLPADQVPTRSTRSAVAKSRRGVA
jgi:excisionase family DNA binding protein